MPFLPHDLAQLLILGLNVHSINFEKTLESVQISLRLEKDRNLVSGGNIVNPNNLIPFDLTGVGELANRHLLQRGLAAASNQVRPQTTAANIADSPLGRLGLLLRAYQRHIADVDLEEIAFSCASLKLTHRFDKRGALDITDCSSQLNDTNVGFSSGLVYRDPGDAFNPLSSISQIHEQTTLTF